MPPETARESRYMGLRAWNRSAHGRRGLERLSALGASWGSRDRADKIVEALGRLEGAPPLPPVNTYRDRAAFLAGACWVLALMGNRSRSG